ncbi:hypothetical protein EDB81DRAFT_112560 [Dactylonectria macrodidyma]|uniref:Uncharacterized protein n=1 Tax=Dactylonectria macrodidyma TaxID=307937 RepID=A0A9P9E596_9HYPO|nr:hypothetical protein EDB81DRAFT_930358 [Dactylonectria macrodidyma]KAH7132684.1 hypothetical protein EDB81DRAFT_112560 [Dactylonectria macrodidyma]
MAPQENLTDVKDRVTTNLSIEIDPTTPGTGIRIAFAAESILNLFMAVPMVLDPRSAIQGQFLPMFDRTTNILQEPPSPEAASITQYLGAFTLAITVGLLLGIPNKPGAIEIRRVVYAMLAALEVVFAPILLWQVWIAGENATGVSSEKAIRLFVVPMSIACALRLWALFVKPHWMGRYMVKRTE